MSPIIHTKLNLIVDALRKVTTIHISSYRNYCNATGRVTHGHSHSASSQKRYVLSVKAAQLSWAHYHPETTRSGLFRIQSLTQRRPVLAEDNSV